MAYAYDHDDELEPPPLTREAVEAELCDWRRHLTSLFDKLMSWLPDDRAFVAWQGERPILESPMRQVGLAFEMFPTLTVKVEATGEGMQFLPEARWVLLTRGRLFLFHPLGMTYIEDHGQPNAPDWRLYPHRDRSRNVPLTREEFLTLLGGLQ
ncbi:hypothetical protein [Niveispirillum sp. KHB5.9]|uniref:hypothetical protein n=1 Tax=Niveispirillum sp. KHB5.9 TaxID=3400269 RepID=UPI003A8B4CCC